MFLVRLPAEWAHKLTLRVLSIVTQLPWVLAWIRRRLGPTDPVLRTNALGLELSSPLGVAAGFDKDAEVFPALAAFGFGFVEVGTVTFQPQPGSPRPRLFRLPRDRALLNRMGFNSAGAASVTARVRRLRARYPDVTVGANIGKTRIIPISQGADDYAASARSLAQHVDYLVINVSSPNTPGLRDLQSSPELEQLVVAVRKAAEVSGTTRRPPILLKVGADLSPEQLDHIAEVVNKLELDGVVATNTSTDMTGLRTAPSAIARLQPGGLSGSPLRDKSIRVLRQLRARIRPQAVLVSVGGIETAEDALQRILAGATVVQSYTGFVYGGPLWAHKVNKELAALLRKRGFASVNDAVGQATVSQDSRSPDVHL